MVHIFIFHALFTVQKYYLFLIYANFFRKKNAKLLDFFRFRGDLKGKRASAMLYGKHLL